jgi:hypothetical protein
VVVILLNKVILLLLQILFKELVLVDLVDAKWCVLHHPVLVFVRFSEFIGLILGREDLSLLDVLRHPQEIIQKRRVRISSLNFHIG